MEVGLPGDYPLSLAVATSLSADELASQDPAAAELASLCAFLAPEPIPQDMITSAVAELPAALASCADDQLAWGRTLTQLGHSALARIGHDELQMHRLTQAILRDRLTPAQAVETRDRTEAILAASDPDDPANSDTWPRWTLLMPHLLAADLAGTDNPGLRSTACNACWYLLARGDAHSGHDLASQLHRQWCGRLGADHPDTLIAAEGREAFEQRLAAAVPLSEYMVRELSEQSELASVTLISPAGLWTGRAPRYTRLSLRAIYGLTSRLERPLVTLMRYRAARSVALAQVYSRPGRMTPEQAGAAISASARSTGFLPTLRATAGRRYRSTGQLGAPVTVAFGSRDRLLLRRSSQHLEQLPAGAETVELPGCGHVPMSDDPAAVAALLASAARKASTME